MASMCPTRSRIDPTAESRITVVVGMSRSGKSAYLKREIRRARRLLVWDPDAEYVLDGITTPLTSRAQLLEVVRTAKTGRFSYIARVNKKEFNYWSLSTLVWGECTAVAEETADVTSWGKAPEHWGQLIRRGGKRHITLYAVTQTPSESDKTVVRNARYLVIFMLATDGDREYMAKRADVSKDRIAALRTVPRRYCQGLLIDKHATITGQRVKPFRLNFRR